jgi:hypothetical protein
VFREASAEHADRANARLTSRFRIVRCITDRDGVGAINLELLENDIEDVGRRF